MLPSLHFQGLTSPLFSIGDMNVGLGDILMQEHEGYLRSVGFANRVLTSVGKKLHSH